MTTLQQKRENSYLFGANAPFVEMLYDQFLRDPQTVAAEWRGYFERLQQQESPGNGADVAHAAIVAEIAERAKQRRAGDSASPIPAVKSASVAIGTITAKQLAVHRLITNFRTLGSRIARINPLGYEEERPDIPSLKPEAQGLGESDMDSIFETDIVGLARAPLREILRTLEQTYCGTLSTEFMHLTNDAQRNWMRDRVEQSRSTPNFDSAKRLRLLEKIVAAETMERFLHTRYVGQKRFSLEGGDVLIPTLDELLHYAGENGVVETVIGMAHRGRLNVLVNILGKLPSDLFSEFEGRAKAESDGSGDVKYHMGFSSTLKTAGGDMHLALAFNPSHLEIVNPVVEGSVRARQDRRDSGRHTVMPVLIHGDAAFAGQGVVMETLNLSQTRGFKTGGTVHIIINNQIGFTTSTPDDARSTFFCTDVAKMIETPIFHVHGDDPEAAAFAIRTAFDFRLEFGKDVVVDLVCFRRHGHNEQDEPMVTQPFMYRKVAKHPGPRRVYARRLIDAGVIQSGDDDKIAAAYRKRLEAGESANPDSKPAKKSDFVDWSKFKSSSVAWDEAVDGAPLETLKKLGEKLSTLPAGFTPHNRLKKIIDQRAKMAAGEIPLDWGMAENLAYATILEEKFPVRLSGQDCGRGTFFHRHAVWHDQNRSKRDGGNYLPLRNLSESQAPFLVIDSILSEEAVLGFEYGFSTTSPDTLTVWEAQFGDFTNGAQVVIDQFIAAGEAKWGRYCGLVLLLPHGYEGQGPEHSSARVERYLQLCAEYNMQVCMPTMPAQIHHLLRRQMLRRGYRRPLIVISPKSLLRHKEAVSPLSDLAAGNSFRPIIGEIDDEVKSANVKRVVFCAGKVYYDALAIRRERKIKDVALIRMEQLYPFPHEQYRAQLTEYKSAKEIVWCQEEPGNQGSWHRIQHYLHRHLHRGQKLSYALRPSSASTATGKASVHLREQKEVIDAALDEKAANRLNKPQH